MNRPDKVKIGFRTFKINYQPGWDANRGDNFGDLTFSTKEIRVNETIDEDEKKVVILHEILHGISRLRGDDVKGNINEEVMAVSFSELLYTIMLDNKELFNWLIGGEK